MHKEITYNTEFFHLVQHFVDMPFCDTCGIPSSETPQKSFPFWVVEKLYAYQKHIRFDGFETWSGTNKPIEEYNNPNIKTGNWISNHPLTRDNDFNKESELVYGIYETFEDAVKQYFEKYTKEQRAWYRKCLKEYTRKVEEKRAKDPEDYYYAGTRLENMIIPEEIEE